jgi:hypothetical protein
MQLSLKEKNILVGLLLGDAHLQKRSVTSNARLHFVQSIKFLPYFYDIYDIFKIYCTPNFKPSIKHISAVSKGERKYQCIGFTTRQLPCFNELQELFYNNEKIKKIPLNIEELLTAEGLAPSYDG